MLGLILMIVQELSSLGGGLRSLGALVAQCLQTKSCNINILSSQGSFQLNLKSKHVF